MPTDAVLENQFVGNSKMVGKGLTRIGTITGALEESQFVGREKEKSDLIDLIAQKEDHQPTVISAWGMEGHGKTTLVEEVYQSPKLSGLFDYRACITIIHPFILEKVLMSLVIQLNAQSSNRNGSSFGVGTKVTGVEALIEYLGNIFRSNKCLIVLNDLFSTAEWDMIIQSFHNMKNGSWIVITTREENIAKHCSSKKGSIYKLKVLENKDALDLFTKKVLVQYNLAPFFHL
ncbi:probable disease resistance protein RXW24L [Panicum virgatum]|uniref:probable disease resistance protein RXW24L n=1 Tax=Panicum virgatum TaxID=38727 RepID=UPI0019D4F9A7|nr:probable disease resistance protein RXW24L [Panicum virgatum]